MADIVLDKKQARIVSEADGPLTVRDHSGREMGLLMPIAFGPHHPLDISRDEIDEIAQRMTTDGPWATTAEVLQRLQPAENQ